MRDSSDSNPLFYDLMLAAAKRSLGLEYGEYQCHMHNLMI